MRGTIQRSDRRDTLPAALDCKLSAAIHFRTEPRVKSLESSRNSGSTYAMKSEHRHQLQTNALAQRLDVLVNQFRPYASTIAGIVVAIVVLMFIWSYWAGSAAGRRDA